MKFTIKHKFFSSAFLIFNLIYSNFAFLSKNEKKCYALALEGGGDAGSWQAGVIMGLISQLPASEVQYDVVSGVSVGSLNGLIVSQHEKGQENQMAEKLYEYWYNITRDQVYQPWNWNYIGILRGFYDKPGIYDNKPLRDLLKKQIKEGNVSRKFSVGITDSTNSKQVVVDIDQLNPQSQYKSIIASTSMPFIFPYVNTTNRILIDGGVLINVDIHAAVRRCREIVDKDSKIIIDVILTQGAEMNIQTANQSYTGFQMLERYRGLVQYKNYLDDLFHQMIDYPDVQYRYIVYPKTPIPSWSIPIEFDQKSVRQMIEMGIEEAKNTIKNQEFEQLKEDYYKSRQLKRNKDRNDNHIFDQDPIDLDW